MINLAKILGDKIKNLEIRMLKAAEERDESSTPNESNHKLTRQISDQLYNSLVDERNALLLMTPRIKRYKNMYKIATVNGSATMNFMIVPDGLGGIMEETTLLVGESSPIAVILATKKIGDEYQFNDSEYLVEDIFENK